MSHTELLGFLFLGVGHLFFYYESATPLLLGYEKRVIASVS